VYITHAQKLISLRASFILIAALNPYPYGFWGNKKPACHCNPLQVRKYLEKLSGPLLDCIDLQVQVQSVEYDTIKITTKFVSSHSMFVCMQKVVVVQHVYFGHNNV